MKKPLIQLIRTIIPDYLHVWKNKIWLRKHIKVGTRGGNDIDIFFISYPKSGRTWLRFLIGKALSLKYEIDERYIPEVYYLTKDLGVPTMQFVHNGMDPHKAERFKYGAIPDDQNRFAQNQVCFLIRDPRDVLVSAYFWTTKHSQLYRGDICDFIRSDEHGIRKLIAFYNHWHQCRHIPKSFYLLSYEALHKAPLETLEKLFCHLAIDMKLEHLEEAIEFARFETMRQWERQGRSRFLAPGDFADDQSYKTRRGQVGSYRNVLAETDIAYIDQVISEMGCPFLFEPELMKYHNYQS